MTVRRECGECSLCCKLLPIRAGEDERIAEAVDALIDNGLANVSEFYGMLPQFDKPAGKPCPHQSHHKGCRVYARRPFGCRYWNCRWLINDDTADLRRPDRSRYVIDIMPDFVTLQDKQTGKETPIEVVQIWGDPKDRDAWRRDPALLAYLERRGREGKAALIRFSGREAITVFPPGTTGTDEWHEVDHGTVGPERTGIERYVGIASARKAWVES